MRILLTFGLAPSHVFDAFAHFPHIAGGDVCVAERAPYTWLLPRCALLVHHGGAGTTVAALAAEIPAVVAPLLQWSDQPAWAAALEERGVGTHLVRASATDAAIDNALVGALASARRAEDVGARVRADAARGAARAAALLTKSLRSIVQPESAKGEAFCVRHCVLERAQRSEGSVAKGVRTRRAAAAAREADARAATLLRQVVGVTLLAVALGSTALVLCG